MSRFSNATQQSRPTNAPYPHEVFELDGGAQNDQLIRLVRNVAGSELFANHVAKEVLSTGRSDWGSLLSAAPDALGRLGQCFVLASDRIASLLMFPDNSGLPYKSLKANLVHCADLGRKAFREAESRMTILSMTAHAVCKPNGRIDEIIEAARDEDLIDIELPELLSGLKKLSIQCIEDTKAIKEKVDEWSESAGRLHSACVDQDETMGREESDLKEEITHKQFTMENKQDQVRNSRAKTASYQDKVKKRESELDEARKKNSNGPWSDLGVRAGESIIDIARALLNPFNVLGSNISPNTVSDQHQQQVLTNTQLPIELPDAGYALADNLLETIQTLALLLTRGPERLHGVDWEWLSGRSERFICILSIYEEMENAMGRFRRERTQIANQVRNAVRPAEEVIFEIRQAVGRERNINVNTEQFVQERAEIWRQKVREVATCLGDIIGEGLRLAKEKEKKRQQSSGIKAETRQMSRAEIRLEHFRVAQKSLFNAERNLKMRLEEEADAVEEFKKTEFQLQKLLSSQVTMHQVKEIVGECVKHLQEFCMKLDQLNTFFRHLENYVDDIDKNHVEPFGQGIDVASKMRRLARSTTDEEKRLGREAKFEKRLDDVRIKALHLKGHFLVARAMADTYIEVSALHIIPGVNDIDYLSLPEAKDMSEAERSCKIIDVGKKAILARKQVRLLANKRQDEFVMAMGVNRGEILEVTEEQQHHSRESHRRSYGGA